MSACVAIVDWTIFYIFNRSGLSTNRFVLVPSLIIIPFVGFLSNLAFSMLVLRVVFAQLSTGIEHGWLLKIGWTAFTAISEELKLMCDDKLFLASSIYVGINFCCVFDAWATHYIAFVNAYFRPHPRAQGWAGEVRQIWELRETKSLRARILISCWCGKQCQ